MIKETADMLNEHFEIKDLGEVNLYLGIQIEKDRQGNYMLSQISKIQQIIPEFGLADANGCSTPMHADYLNITGEENLLHANEQYRQSVGSLLYILMATTTISDIATAVSVLCHRVSKPRQCDWTAVKRVIRYLKETINVKLRLEASDNMELVGYVDADWADDKSDRKSTSGYLFKLGEGVISWMSKKQGSVALSSTLDENNQGCIKIACNDKVSARTKHIDVRHHHLRELQFRGVTNLKYCASDQMIADIMTKPLTRDKLLNIRQ